MRVGPGGGARGGRWGASVPLAPRRGGRGYPVYFRRRPRVCRRGPVGVRPVGDGPVRLALSCLLLRAFPCPNSPTSRQGFAPHKLSSPKPKPKPPLNLLSPLLAYWSTRGGASLVALYRSKAYQCEQLHGRSSDALASSASTAMRDLYPTSSLRATALLPRQNGTKPLSSSTYCHSCGSCPGTTSIRRSIGDSPLMLCPLPLACTMLILVPVGSPVRTGSTIFGHALWLRVCWLCSLITLNLEACCQLFCYLCMSCWRSHHLRGCM